MFSRFPLLVLIISALGTSNSLAGDPGEDSRGLWQINATAKGAPQTQGRNMSPWTTTHGGGSVRVPLRPTITIRPSIRLR